MRIFFTCFISLSVSLQSFAGIDFARIEKSIVTIYQVNISNDIVAQGTGFFIDSETIVTNFHVVFDKEKSGRLYSTNGVKVELSSGEIYYPNTVNFDSVRDIALLRTYGEDPYPYFLPVSKRKPKVGETVWTIGSPQGLNNSWSNGIISSVRNIRNTDTIFQFTAPISPGSSGGPVLNSLGQVVGISTFKMKEGEGLNFFIDISTIHLPKPSMHFYLKANSFEKDNTVSNYIKLAKIEFDKGAYNTALNYLEKANDLSPANYKISQAKADNYLQLRNLEKAEEYLLKCEKESNSFIKLIDFERDGLWGALHEMQGKYQQAANDYLEWSDKISGYSKNDTVPQWGYLKAAGCFEKIEQISKAKLYIDKITDPLLMDYVFYSLRVLIYAKALNAGDISITQNMVCSDLMRLKKEREDGNSFEEYKKIKELFDQICK